ncbi:MAG TPA: hypothetical protein VH988_07625 [Thermoanaerobaculia bacterium]|jgi:hypothetical protein|nr:hypothetical protein [Thermoanaerobaculia bacterium]
MHGFPKALALAPLFVFTLTLAAADSAEPPPQRVQFEKGKSSTTIRKTLQVEGDDVETHEYRLRAGAGQVLTVHFEAAEPNATYSVACPGDGITHAKGTAWSLTLPESGDYTITVAGYGAKESFPYTLEVGVQGKPHPVPPQGLTGTWALVRDPDSTIEIRESPPGKLLFAVSALWKGANWKESGPHTGEIGGTVDLHNGKAVFQDKEADCMLAMSFSGGKLKVEQEGGCGFGANVRADGIYKRASLCAEPELAGEP